MPPLALAALLQRILPWLSADGRAVINILICENGRVESAQTLSERVGLRSRFQLARLLHREGLPPYEELAGWVCVLYWMLLADAGEGRGALRSLANRSAIDLASSYRLVRRVTGHKWKDLRRLGTEQVTHWFLRRVHPPTARPRRDVRAAHDHGGPALQAGARRSSDTQRCRLPLAGNPYGIGVHGRDLAYVTRGGAAAIERLDLRSRRFNGTIAVGCTPTYPSRMTKASGSSSRSSPP